ncbi:hypothetical protein PF005_g6091 [Phytophthora fragariae]|uniref:Uncharacterized protein n=1 Tax=Phytophthora fragariae TaxID=53985 RepID=A0A6A3SM21_9STRA|nr:hypothetical protein PF007_g8409 [Phytophthora fragariae]KAE9223969.1 hypothetical protein PF005_g6091 [Phytophthora fragariae]KAE9320293.1 hypothetical protein PF001_g5475 [Phytophthora fragariae]
MRHYAQRGSTSAAASRLRVSRSLAVSSSAAPFVSCQVRSVSNCGERARFQM